MVPPYEQPDVIAGQGTVRARDPGAVPRRRDDPRPGERRRPLAGISVAVAALKPSVRRRRGRAGRRGQADRAPSRPARPRRWPHTESLADGLLPLLDREASPWPCSRRVVRRGRPGLRGRDRRRGALPSPRERALGRALRRRRPRRRCSADGSALPGPPWPWSVAAMSIPDLFQRLVALNERSPPRSSWPTTIRRSPGPCPGS